jgi:NAD(P)H dehydrogenase (quinone)
MTVFLVTGSTGRLGGAALRTLLDRVPAEDVRVLVRSPDDALRMSRRGLTAHLGDYDHPESLRIALDGVDRLIFISSPVLDPLVRTTQHRAVVEAAVAADVRHVVYTSAMGAPHDPGHSAAENALAESGIGHTILRNALYTDAFVALAIEQAASGAIRSASENQPVVTASIADLAESAVRAAMFPPAQTLWELRGPAWTFAEMARMLSLQMERPITHHEVRDVDTGPFAVLFPLIRRGVYASETGDLGDLLGCQPQGIADVAAGQLRLSH